MLYEMREQMKEQQVQSNPEQEQMILDHENIIREQEKLKLLNQQLQTQVAALQNNSTQIEGDPESNRSLSLHALDELIEKRIVKVKLPQHLILTTHIHDSPLSKINQECEFPRKFSTLTFNRYSGVSIQFSTSGTFETKW